MKSPFSISLGMALGFAVLAAAGLVLARGVGALVIGAQAPIHTQLFSLGVAQLFGFGGALVAAKWVYARDAEGSDLLGLHYVSPKHVMFAATAGVALQFPLAELSNIVQLWFPVSLDTQRMMHTFATPTTAAHGAMAVIVLVIIAPATEELLFRGLLCRGLCGSIGPYASLAVSSVLFGVFHWGTVASVVYATVAGVLLGLVVLRTGSVVSTIFIHGAVNLVPLVVNENVIAIRGFNVVTERVYHVPWYVLAGSTMLVATLLPKLWNAQPWNRRVEPTPKQED